MTKNWFTSGARLSAAVAIVCGFGFLATFTHGARDKSTRETIQATAMGQQGASGKTFNVTVSIQTYSTPDDQKALIAAFNAGGQDTLVKTLSTIAMLRALAFGKHCGAELNRFDKPEPSTK